MEARHVEIVSKKLYEFFWHFVGPDKVPLTAASKIDIAKAIELLAGMGTRVIVLGDRLEALRSVIETLKKFDELGEMYQDKKNQEACQRRAPRTTRNS